MKPLLTQLLEMSAGMAVNVAAFKLDPRVLLGGAVDVAAFVLIAWTFYGMIKRRAW